MYSNDPAIQEVFYLHRKHLRLLSDPLRQRILELLCRREMSATELRAEIGNAPSNLHYYVDWLRDAGLIRLVRTAPRRGATEKYYRAVARTYTLAPELAVQAPADRTLDPEMLSVVRGFLEKTYAALARSLQRGYAGEGEGSVVPVITGCSIRTSPEQMEELRRGLVDWLQACQESQDPEGEVEFAALSLMFPVDLPPAAESR